MLAAGRARVERAGLAARIELREGRAEALPFDDARVRRADLHLSLRYVDDPAATLRELARVVRPGGDDRDARVRRAARRLAAALGAVRRASACPPPARVVSPAWREVGRFLGPSIRGFYER